MPLPKNLDEKEWKRRISFSEITSKQNPDYIELEGPLTSDAAKFEPTEINPKGKPIHKGINPKDLSNKDLIYYHSVLHTYYRARPHNWSKEDIVNLHVLILKEMEKRGINHKSYDDLDKTSREFLSNDIPERAQNLLNGLEDAVLIDNFISVIGSFITSKEKPSDIDFLLRSGKTTPEYLERAIYVRISKMLGDTKIHLTSDTEGPHDDYIPVYDLVLRKRKPVFVDLAEQAVSLGKAYLPQKPSESAKDGKTSTLADLDSLVVIKGIEVKE